MSEFLSADELRDLTQRAHRDAQAKALEGFGIPFRRVGRAIVVSRHHAREWLAGRVEARKMTTHTTEAQLAAYLRDKNTPTTKATA